MLCFQCEGTADGAELQDKLTGALIGLVRATEGNEDLVSSSTDKAILEGLSAAFTDVCRDNEAMETLIAQVQEEKRKLVPNCFFCAAPCGRTADYDMQKLWNADEDIRSLKTLILCGIRGIAAICKASAPGYADKAVNELFRKALFNIGMDLKAEELLPIVREVGEVTLKCMALWDKTDVEAYVSEEVIQAVKAGEVRHIFLTGGCSDARYDRSCAEFMKQLPDSSIVLAFDCDKRCWNSALRL